MDVKKETLDNLSNLLGIKEVLKQGKKRIESGGYKPRVTIDGFKFILDFYMSGNTLHGTDYSKMSGISFTAEEKEQISNFILNMYEEKLATSIKEAKKNLVSEVIGGIE